MRLEPFSIDTSAVVLEGKLVKAKLHIGADGRFAEEASRDNRVIVVDDGSLILPGFVDLHVNFLPRLLSARSGLGVPASAAAKAYEAVLMASGITTAFHLLPVHRWAQDKEPMLRTHEMFRQFDTLARCCSIDLFSNIALEVLDAEAIDFFLELKAPTASVVSLTEHVPGHREFRARPSALISRLAGDGVLQEEIDELISLRKKSLLTNASPRKEAIAQYCHRLGIPVFSHDDEFIEDVNFATDRLGAVVSEFPLTEKAAATAIARGMGVVVGAPNVLRGASHVGNVSARSLIDRNLATILSSDYVPYTLLPALSLLRRQGFSWATLCQMTSEAPAEAAALHDRGKIAPGMLADFVRVRESGDREVILIELWKAGVCRLRFDDVGCR